jgi:hypothetical protein
MNEESRNPDPDSGSLLERVPNPVVSERRRRYREAAAVLVSFDWDKLRFAGDTRPEVPAGETYENLEDDVDPPSITGRGRSELRLDIRQDVLSRMSPEQMRSALEANEADESNAMQRVLSDLIRGRASDPIELPLNDLEGLDRLLQWFPANFPGLASRQLVEAILPRKRLFSQFAHLDEHFVGREDQLGRLQDYIGLNGAPPKRANREVPIVLYGVGGIGKSALLAHFLTTNANKDRTVFPFAYLDCDRPSLKFQAPESGGGLDANLVIGNLARILKEAVSQLCTQYPGPTTAFDDLCVELDRFSRTNSSLDSAAAQKLCDQLGAAVRMANSGQEPPLLFIFDAFEESQFDSPSAEIQLGLLFNQLKAGYGNFRMVVSGRSALPDLARLLQAPVAWKLREIGWVASDRLLKELGIDSEDFRREIYRNIGGNPLDLRLLAATLLNDKVLNSSAEEQRNWLKSNAPRDARLRGNLFLRILDHIHSEAVREIVYPGLVLRKITPEIILEILNEPCRLGLSSIEESVDLFNQLRRETFLYEWPDTGRSLRIRSDLRATVLDLLEQYKPRAVEKIELAAIDFYQNLSEQTRMVSDRAEEIYHRLRRKQGNVEITSRWLPGVDVYLRESLAELPDESQVILAAKLGVTISRNRRKNASQQDWEEYAEENMRKWLTAGFPGEALQIARERFDRLDDSSIPLVEAKTLFCIEGREEDARALIPMALAASRAAGSPRAELQVVLLDALLADRFRNPKQAYDQLTVAETLARNTNDHVRHCKILLFRKDLCDRFQGLFQWVEDDYRQLLEAFQRIPLKDRKNTPVLLRSVAAALGEKQPLLFAQALQLGDPGLGLTPGSLYRYQQDIVRRAPDFIQSWVHRPLDYVEKDTERSLVRGMLPLVEMGREVLRPVTYPEVDPNFDLLSDIPGRDEITGIATSQFRKYLSSKTLNEVWEVAKKIVNGDELRRQKLLDRIPPSVTVQIAITDSVEGQILTDLNALNGIQKLHDGSPPLKTWIDNATEASAAEKYDPALQDTLDSAFERVNDLLSFDRSVSPALPDPSPVPFPSCILCYTAEHESSAVLLHDALRKANVQCWLAGQELKVVEDFLMYYRDCIVLMASQEMAWAAPILDRVKKEEERREGSPVLIEIAASENGAELRHWKRYMTEPFMEKIADLENEKDLEEGLEKLIAILRNEERKPTSMFRG